MADTAPVGWYLARLRLRSRPSHWPTSDWILGHLAWAYRAVAGDSALERWLNRFETADPPVVVSDAWPAGWWPMPLVTRADWVAGRQDPSAADPTWRRRARQQPWIPADLFGRLAAGDPAVPDLLTRAAPFPAIDIRRRVHTSVDRRTGSARDGTLWESWEPGGPDRITIVVRTAESAVVAACFEWLAVHGWGGGLSRGSGWIALEAFDPFPIPRVTGATGEIWLGHGIPGPHDPTHGVYRIHTKYGAVGGEVARPWKAPVAQITRGAVFARATPWTGIVGRVVRDIAEDPAVRELGWTLTWPVNWPELTADG